MAVLSGLSLSSRALTLEEALATASEKSPELRAARAEAQAAAAEARGAALWENPELEFEAEGIGGDNIGADSAEYTVMLSQEFPMVGKTASRREIAGYSTDAARLEMRAAGREFEAVVRGAFVGLQAEEEILSVQNQQVELAEEFLATIQKRRDAGAASEIDVLSAEMAVEQSRIDRQAAENTAAAARNRLARLLGVPEVRKTDGDFFQPLEKPAVSLSAEAVPVLQVFQTLEKQAQAESRLAEKSRIPDLTLGAGARYEEDGNVHTYLFAASIPLPLFNRGQSDVLAAGLRSQASAALREQARRDLEQEVDQLVSEFEMSVAEATRCRETLLPKAERAVELMMDGAASGRYGRREQIEARQALAEIQVRAVEAQRAAWKAQAQLLKFRAGDDQ